MVSTVRFSWLLRWRMAAVNARRRVAYLFQSKDEAPVKFTSALQQYHSLDRSPETAQAAPLTCSDTQAVEARVATLRALTLLWQRTHADGASQNNASTPLACEIETDSRKRSTNWQQTGGLELKSRGVASKVASRADRIKLMH